MSIARPLRIHNLAMIACLLCGVSMGLAYINRKLHQVNEDGDKCARAKPERIYHGYTSIDAFSAKKALEFGCQAGAS